MKKLYHLLVTSYELRIKLPRFCFAKSPLQNLKGIYCSGVARNAPNHIIPYLKPLTSYLIPLTFFLFLPFVAMAQQCPFDNPDPNMNTTEIKAYYGYQWIYSGDPMDYASKPNAYSSSPSPSDGPIPRYDAPFLYEGVVPNRHKYIPESERDNDKIIPELLTVPLDAEWSIKLGNDQIYYECEAIVYEFTPNIMNPILLLDFAVVFEDPDHPFSQQPRFVLRVTDEYGNLLEQCTEYDVTSAATISGFNTWQPQGSYQGEERWHNTTIHWRDWTKMSVDLSKFVGHPIQVQIITYDCNQGAHFGYCYFTAKCMPNTLQFASSCDDGGTFKLKAPDAFESYLWSDGQTTDTAIFNINDDIINTNITCKAISQMGCECTLYAYITDSSGIKVYETPYTGTICEGETYTLNHFNLPPQAPGIHEYQLVVVDIGVCEIFVSNLTLEVIPRYNYIKDSICTPNPFLKHSQWPNIPELPTPGIWRDSIATGTLNDCILYDVMELLVSVSMGTLTIQGDPSPCTGELVTYSFIGAQTLTSYSWDVPGNAVVVSGRYTPQITLYFTDASDTVFKLHGANGCGPGVATLNITPYQSYDIQKNVQVCQGEVYNGFDFNLGVQNEVGFFVHSKHLQSVHGCDSTVTLGINVLPVHTVRIEPIDTMLCNQTDDITLWALIDMENYPANDCPTPDPGNYLSAFMYNCGYSYLWSTGDTTKGITVIPNTTTTYTVTVTSGIGCKVSASQIVVVAPDQNVVVYDTICYGETYSAYGITASTSGSYTKNNYSMGGCIRDVTVHLTVLDEAKAVYTRTFCAGVPFTEDGFDFTLYGSGSYIDTIHFISHKGCDSLVIFNFTIKPQKDTIIYDNICQYEIYDKGDVNGFDEGEQYFSGLQVYTKNLTASNGCDSLVILRLNVYPHPVNTINFAVVPDYAGVLPTIFTNQSYYLDESIIAGWEWYLDDNLFATTKDASTIIPSAGTHTIKLRVTSINGCWDETSQTINVPSCPVPTISVTGSSTQTACGIETVTFTGTFSGADKLTVQTLGSHGRKARLTYEFIATNEGTFTISYTSTIANVNKTIQIILTAIDSSLPCPGKTQSFTVDVKPKPKVRFKGECAE